MRGKKCKEWEEGEKTWRWEGSESSRREGGGRKGEESNESMRTRRAGGLFIGHTSEKKGERERGRKSLYIFHGTGFHDTVRIECEPS